MKVGLSSFALVLVLAGCGSSSGSPGAGLTAAGVASSSAASSFTSAPGVASAPPSSLRELPSARPLASASEPRPACATSAGAELQLLVDAKGTLVRFGLHNAGTEAVCVYTHVATHETQHDWLTVEIVSGGGQRTIALDDDRDKSAFVTATIAPGATDWQSFDLGAWARRARNGKKPLASGALDARAIYDTTKEREVWAGRLERSFVLHVP